MINDGAVEAVIADAHRREWGRLLAATARTARDLDLAEEAAVHGLAAVALPPPYRTNGFG